MNTPALSDLDAFAAVARERNFRGVANKRGVSASSLSDAVRRLETRLGVRLLNRTTHSVTPTEAGRQLVERLTPALQEVEDALDAVNSFRDNPTGTLRLNVPVIVARVILPPIAAGFLQAYPGIRLEVIANNDFIDVLAAGFDAGIRYDERLELDMIAVPIGPHTQRYVLAATPAYLEVNGRPQMPDDLMHQACIHHRFSSGAMLDWELERDGETLFLNPPARLITSQTDMQASATLSGLGITMGFEELYRPYFGTGALEPVLPQWWTSFSGPLPLFCRTQTPSRPAARLRRLHREHPEE